MRAHAGASSRESAEYFAHRFFAKREDLRELRLHEEGMHEIAEWSERQHVSHPVGHFDSAAVERLEVMLVVPDAIWADALLIHEEFPLLHMRDLGEPADRKYGRWKQRRAMATATG